MIDNSTSDQGPYVKVTMITPDSQKGKLRPWVSCHSQEHVSQLTALRPGFKPHSARGQHSLAIKYFPLTQADRCTRKLLHAQQV